MDRIEFTDGERTFTCQAQGSAASPATLWWWVSVSGESSRYAAFRAEAGDTAQTLRPRIVAYYDDMVAARSRAPEPRAHWSQRRRAETATKTEPETTAADDSAADSAVG